ncbi:MAG TPA: hypothetical protein VJ914_06325 [Pseudonocardiaceae bacterium]|nr:hypothetical protein [Pseudonocardiaceae bacterium]
MTLRDISDFHRVTDQRRRNKGKLIVAIGLPLAIVALVAALFTLRNAHGAGSAAADAAPNPNCTLTVPANPLSATGLATPYQLSATQDRAGQCHEANAAQSAFVEATIIDPATGAVSVYRPLILDRGSRPGSAPVVPKLPNGAIVGLWFGFNGAELTLRGSGAAQCVNGYHGSLFTQVAYCNGPAFFTAANNAISQGKLTIPQLGTAKDGMPCMTTRDFALIDQDQSDNVTTSYLVLPNGRTAQNTTANAKQLANAQVLVNGSDNLLLDGFVDPALGCQPFTAPDLTNPGSNVSSLALNELMAAARQPAPAALVPTNDPMTEINGHASTAKTNLYRVGVDQPPVGTAGQSPSQYCRDMLTIGIKRIQLDKALTSKAPSPDPAAGNNLFTFLAQRLSGSFTNLGCGRLLRTGNPVHLKTNAAGVTISATFTTPRF